MRFRKEIQTVLWRLSIASTPVSSVRFHAKPLDVFSCVQLHISAESALRFAVEREPQAACLAPRSSPDPRCRPDHRITITSTLRLDPSTPVSTRRKTHPILDRQPKTQPVIPCPSPHPQSLGSPMHHLGSALHHPELGINMYPEPTPLMN